MLLDEGREIESLQGENARLQEELNAANTRLEEYSSLLHIIDRLGSYVDRLTGTAPEQPVRETVERDPELSSPALQPLREHIRRLYEQSETTWN